MDDKKKIYTQADIDAYSEAIKRECEQMLLRQRDRIDELRTSLRAAEKKIAEFEKQKSTVYKAITAALKKADDIERVSLIKYNQEIAQLKSFHNKWIGYFNKIIEKYPLDDELVAASKVNGKIAETLERAGDIDEQYRIERDRLMASLEEDEELPFAEEASSVDAKQDDYADRSPAGFSIAEALHPKDDLKDIMRELGIIIDDD